MFYPINCRINLDKNELEREENNYKPLPVFYDFHHKKDEVLRHNFLRINKEIDDLIIAFKKPVISNPAKATFKT